MRQSRKSPALAAVLNFSFWGLGYVYVGERLGLLLVIYNIMLAFLVILISFTTGFLANIKNVFDAFGTFERALIASLFIISVILAWHAYEMAKGMNILKMSGSVYGE